MSDSTKYSFPQDICYAVFIFSYSAGGITMDPNIYALVLDTLNRATSQDPGVLKPAEKKLQEWEVEPRFYSVLLVRFTKTSNILTTRYLLHLMIYEAVLPECMCMYVSDMRHYKCVRVL